MNAVIPALSDFLDLQHITSDQFWGLLRLARELKEDRNRLGQNAPIPGRQVAGPYLPETQPTHASFEMDGAVGRLRLYLSPQEVGLGARERGRRGAG